MSGLSSSATFGLLSAVARAEGSTVQGLFSRLGRFFLSAMKEEYQESEIAVTGPEQKMGRVTVPSRTLPEEQPEHTIPAEDDTHPANSPHELTRSRRIRSAPHQGAAGTNSTRPRIETAKFRSICLCKYGRHREHRHHQNLKSRG